MPCFLHKTVLTAVICWFHSTVISELFSLVLVNIRTICSYFTITECKPNCAQTLSCFMYLIITYVSQVVDFIYCLKELS